MGSDRAYRYDADAIEALRSRYRGDGPLERDFYTSDEVFRAELDRIWRRHWLYAGHDCQIPETGDYMTWNVGRDVVLIVRQKDGSVSAFHNICRHRGSRLCAQERGNARAIVCPYHAWTYGLDGSLKTATEREFGLDRDTHGLKRVAVRSLGGLMFVALSDDAVSFSEAASEIAPQMAHQGFDRARVAVTKRYVVQANWKIVFENNRECYHCINAHPEYISGTWDIVRFDERRNAEVDEATLVASARFEAMGLGGGAVASSAMTGDYWRVTRAPLLPGWKTQSLDGSPIGPLMGTMRSKDQWSDGTLRCTVFPNFWQHASDDHAVATRLTPLGPSATQVDVTWFVDKDAVAGRDYDESKLTPFWQRTSEQDWVICEAQQVGVSSPAYEPGAYSSTRETNVQQFIHWYIGAIAMPRAEPQKPKLRSRGFRDRPGA